MSINKVTAKHRADYLHGQTTEAIRRLATGPMFLDDSTMEAVRRLTTSPKFFDDKTMEAMRRLATGPKFFDDKTAEAMRRLATGPTLFDDKTMEAMRRLATGPKFFDDKTMEAMRRLATSPALKLFDEYLNSPGMASLFAPSEKSADGEAQETASDSHIAIRVAAVTIDWLVGLLQRAGSVLSKRNALRLAEFLLPLIFAAVFDYYWHAMTAEEVVEDGERTRSQIERVLDNERENASKLQQEFDDLNARVEKLQELLERELDDASRGDFRRVRRSVPLCATKTYCKNRLALLAPGAEVQVVENAQKWVRVIALMESGQVLNGWLLKKYLTRQAPTP